MLSSTFWKGDALPSESLEIQLMQSESTFLFLWFLFLTFWQLRRIGCHAQLPASMRYEEILREESIALTPCTLLPSFLPSLGSNCDIPTWRETMGRRKNYEIEWGFIPTSCLSIPSITQTVLDTQSLAHQLNWCQKLWHWPWFQLQLHPLPVQA